MSDNNRPFSVPPFAPAYRASGLLLHITSLPSPYGIGDVGPAAISWIDHLAEAGQSWWQALPLGPTGYGNSPYQSLSSFAGNGLLIGPDWLIEDELLRPSDCQNRSFPQNEIDYRFVTSFKHRLLEIAWANFSAGARSDLRAAYEQFRNDQACWLEDYALFRALKARFDGAYYLEWPAELVRRDPAALERARRELADQIGQVCFGQFLLFRQGERLKAHAHSRGVGLIGDLPFFVSPDSSDVWANPELFLLDDQRRPRFVAGVPPDYFSAQGQLWGNPIYNWDALLAVRLWLVYCPAGVAASPRRRDSLGSFPCLCSGLARPGWSVDRAIRKVGPRSRRRFLCGGRERIGCTAVYRRGFGANHT
jgi:4-alpha-glucanotransferase